MKERNRGKTISNLAAVLTFCVFAVGILSVLLGGADAYSRLTRRDSRAYDSRTCVQYIAAKVRQASAPDCVALSEFGDGDALVLYSEIDGTGYLTRIYCCDGWLMELFFHEGGNFAPEDGERVMPIGGMFITEEDGLFWVCVVGKDGTETEQILFLRGREGAES